MMLTKINVLNKKRTADMIPQLNNPIKQSAKQNIFFLTTPYLLPCYFTIIVAQSFLYKIVAAEIL